MPRITHFIMPRYFAPGFRPHEIIRIYMLFKAFITHIYATQLLYHAFICPLPLLRIYMPLKSFITHLYALSTPQYAYTCIHIRSCLAAIQYMRTSLQSSSGYTSLHTYFAFHYAPIRISLCSHSHFVMLLFAFHYALKLHSIRFPAMPYWL